MSRRRSLVLFAAVVFTAGCTSSAAPHAAPKHGAKPGAAATVTWTDAEADPCLLLPMAEAKAAVPGAKKDPIAAGPRSCRYQTPTGGTIGVDLFLPQTPESYQSRIAGTAMESGRPHAVLNSPGAGIFVRNRWALALVTLRRLGPARATVVVDETLADDVARHLPGAPPPGKGLAGKDLCGVVTNSTFGPGTVAADVITPSACAYRLSDFSTVSIEFTPNPTHGSNPVTGSPWAGGGAGATWQGVASGRGASGRALFPVAGGVFLVDLTSPVRDQAKLQQLAAKVGGMARRAAGH